MAQIVEVKDLVKVFNGTIRAVDGISFEVEEGEVYGFLGPNGAGKTTTISILTTLLRPTSGSAVLGGYDVVRQADEVRRIIGLVPQELTVDDELTGRENMMLQADLYNVPRADALDRIELLLDLVSLEDAVDRLVKTYSGGMRKRLELAEGLIHRPKVLFLDEPTLGLDIQTRTVMWEHIRKLQKEHNTTIFLTTHYLEEADSLCDRIAIIDQGKIVALDSPGRLKAGLGGDVIDIKVQGDGLGEAIGEVEGVLEVRETEDGYRVKAVDGAAVAPSVLRRIWDSGSQVQSVSISRPNLDQVFLEYTGRSLRDAIQTGATDLGKRMAEARQRRRMR